MIITLFLTIHATVQLSQVARKLNPDSDDSPRPSHQSCVETYGITLNSSEYYVREWAPGIPAANPSGTPELSTVLRGMARNGCGENLKSVKIKFVVRDEEGHTGRGSYLIDSMMIGEVKSFEGAWMGKLTSYEVTANQ